MPAARVTSVFAQWESAQERVSNLERQFNAAVTLHSQGKGEFPDRMYAELKVLRREADALFQVAAHSLQTAADHEV